MTSTEILNKIREIQVNNDRRYFAKGIFPSYRKNPLLRKSIPDDNIFFSASMAYIINSLNTHFTENEKEIAAYIINDIKPNFQDYTNKPERNSYNFWQKKPGKHFPNGILYSKLDKFVLPDDIDTTSLVQLCLQPAYPDAFKTKQTITQHANSVKNYIKNGHENLKHLKAYSTWFGEKMPIEFDVCVLSNLFLWVNNNNFELNENDFESLKLIEITILNSLYFKSAFKSSPEYPNTCIILYHISRLISSTKYLGHCKQKLINDINLALQKTTTPFEYLLLTTSLCKLNCIPQNKSEINISPEIISHWWFTAGMLSAFGNSFIQKLAPMSLFHYRFYCPAFNLAIFLEYKILTYIHRK